jgi:hypothetical protein
MGKDDTLLNAVIGAVVTVVTTFIPFSPVLGGAVAAYLQESGQSASVKVGAISGLVASIPFVLFVLFLGSLFPFLPAFGTPGAVAGLFGIFLVFAILTGALYTIGLSALGGYLGWYVRTETDIDI